MHHWGVGDRLSWHHFHDVHSSYIVAAAIGASASGCTLGAATYKLPAIPWLNRNAKALFFTV